LIDYAFNRLKLNKVEIYCAENNIKSQAVPKRFGFTKEGVIREAEFLYDRFVNLEIYGLLSREWD
jgi:ribosomal-protein-serine acetyltransferase